MVACTWPARRALDALDALDERRRRLYLVPEHANKLAYSLGGLIADHVHLSDASGFSSPSTTTLRPWRPTRAATSSPAAQRLRPRFPLLGRDGDDRVDGLHLLRVFVSASYKRPREANWVLGVVLVGITAALFFTGTVLKWDQESIEALGHNIEIGKLLGRFGFWFSPTFGGIPLLTRLYVVHIAVLPFLLTLVLAVHLLLVKRHGMAPSPFRKGPEPEPTRPFSSHLAELGSLALVLIGVLTILAVFLPPAHGPAPVQGIEVTKPPWPMLWIYPIEDWLGVSGILWATLAIFAALLIVPFVDRSSERSPRRRLPSIIVGVAVVITLIALIVYAGGQPVASHLG
ncbi:MAG: cytochrome b N-terminal domain-containing protein [Actinomycetota bacterium]